jgi:hypothetical protein
MTFNPFDDKFAMWNSNHLWNKKNVYFLMLIL